MFDTILAIIIILFIIIEIVSAGKNFAIGETRAGLIDILWINWLVAILTGFLSGDMIQNHQVIYLFLFIVALLSLLLWQGGRPKEKTDKED